MAIVGACVLLNARLQAEAASTVSAAVFFLIQACNCSRDLVYACKLQAAFCSCQLNSYSVSH